MHKLLIADGNEEFRLALADALQVQCRILCCSSGKDALSLLRQEKPDILVMDVMLPELDGITLLEQASAEGLSPRILIVSSFLTDYVFTAAQRLGIGYVMRKPCDIGAVAARILDLGTCTVAPAKSREPRTQLSELLLRLGISTKHDGYLYLLDSILMVKDQPALQITKIVYPTVAKQYGRKKGHVERSIRNAVEAAFDRGDSRLWQHYFPECTVRPSNAVFVSRIAEELRREME